MEYLISVNDGLTSKVQIGQEGVRIIPAKRQENEMGGVESCEEVSLINVNNALWLTPVLIFINPSKK